MTAMRTIAAAVALVLAAMPVAAKEKAQFIDGTYATEDGCAKLAAIAAGTPRNVETVPEVLDAEGFKGWEGACEFTHVFEHDPGRVWVGLMVCSEGQTIAPQTYVFIRGEDDSLEVAASGQDEPELYKRCDAGKGKTKP
ncbi:MAG: hypothetical protein KDJ18_11955 [Hyphomicrobiaceae bacterium]|nr:hypothetical protein [Hyphomicrobiaceae bacterium]